MFKKSIKAYKEACEVIPGGVDSPVRAFKSVGGTPPFIKKVKVPIYMILMVTNI